MFVDTPWCLSAEPRHRTVLRTKLAGLAWQCFSLLRKGAFTSHHSFRRLFLLSIQVLGSNALTLRARRRLIGGPPKRGALSSRCSP